MERPIHKLRHIALLATATLLAGCAGGSQSQAAGQRQNEVALAVAPAPSGLIGQEIVAQERRCTYSGVNGQFYIAVGLAERCPARYGHPGYQWDQANRRF